MSHTVLVYHIHRTVSGLTEGLTAVRHQCTECRDAFIVKLVKTTIVLLCASDVITTPLRKNTQETINHLTI